MRKLALAFLLAASVPPAFAATEIVDGIEWTYSDRWSSGATIESGRGYGHPAIASDTSGSISIPDRLGGLPVTGIGLYAFHGCSGLTSISIPDSVTSIEWSAFEDCSGLTSITIPDTVTYVGVQVFTGCSGLTSISIGRGVRVITRHMFSRCSGLMSITIPDNVTVVEECAFQQCTNLTSVSMPDNVTAIGRRLFYGCSNLTSFAIPSCATNIGVQAFDGCSRLTSITIPDGVTSIGESAFQNCSSLESVEILDPDTRVGDRAFYGCTSLKRLTIPGEYNRREEYEGEEVERYYVRNDDIFETRQRSGYWLEYTQETIEELFVTPGSQRIGEEAFLGFSSCTNVVIPASVTSIEYEAFCGCTGLASVVIPEGVTSIGQGAFMGCSGLTSVRISDSVTSIGLGAFDECADELFDTESIPGVKLVDGWAAGHTDSLSGALNLSGIRGIVGGAFFGCSGLTSIVVPNGMTEIGRYTFYECTGLMSIQIPNSVTNIVGWDVFYRIGDESPLRDYGYRPRILLPARFEGHTSDMGIPEYCTVVFRGGGPLSIRETSLLTGWGDRVYFAFLTPDGGYGNVSWTATGIPQGLSLSSDGILSGTPTECGVYSVSVTATDERGDTATRTFDFVVATSSDWRYRIVDGCAVLGTTTIDYQSGNITLGQTAVPKDTTGEVVIPDTVWDWVWEGDSYAPVVSIGDYAFYMCSELTSVVIPNSVTNIGGLAFYDCSGLTSITIPASVTDIGEGVFANCPGLTSIEVDEANPVYDSRNGCNAIIGPSGMFNEVLIAGCKNTVIPDGVTGIGGVAFAGCTELTSIEIPDSVTTIGVQAFRNCSGLTSITIPDGVTRIGEEAFAGCRGLTSIAIPESVTFVGEAAFGNCSGLKSVTIPCSVTNLGKSTFRYCTSLESVEITNPELVFTSSGWGNYAAFSGCSALKRVMIPGEYGKVEGYGSTVFGGTEKTVKEVLVTPGSTRIGESAFKGFTACTRVAIPDSVAEIGANAFSGCSALASVTVPPGVTSIGDNAFSGCGSLRTFFCPDTLSGAVSGIGVPSGCNVVFYDASLRWAVLGFDWAFAADASAGDGYSMRSQALGSGGTAKLEATVEGIGTLSFDWRVSTFARRHYARFYVDGAQQKQITGETEWTTETIRLGEGTHALKWTYEKSAAATSGEDAAFLDNVHWSPLTLDEALDATNLVWTTDAEAPWIPQIAETADGADAAKSGTVSGEATSGLATTVEGPGELSWKWKARIDGFGGVDVWLDGEMLLDPYLDESVDWTDATLDIEGAGPHRIEFRFWNGGDVLSDCACVDQVSWTPAKPVSVVVEGVEIPVLWLDENASAAVAAAGGDYEAAARATAANGVNKVWECYVSGVSPTNAVERFEARVGFEAGEPVVSWTPDLNEGGTKSERVYTVEGKTNLVDQSWGPTNDATRFFRVKVEMP